MTNGIFGKLLRAKAITIAASAGSIERVKIPTSSFGNQNDGEDHKRISRGTTVVMCMPTPNRAKAIQGLAST
jgi:hypothetical protein